MSGPLWNSLITKLAVSNELDGEDIRALLALPIQTRFYDAHQSIVREGDDPGACLDVENAVLHPGPVW